MSLAPGTRLGPYDITAPIGTGGMGAVYRARDTRLGRDVAIKVSAAEFTERFEREAQSVAALNHPNICQLYDVGPNYLVMEYIEGAPVGHTESMRKLIDLAVQMADGMAAAHAAGLVHRDLKPDNILVTADGRVKILDFGIAKPVLAAADSQATRSVGITDPGTRLGTVAYMSPEQARGQPNLGPQSDQFSFGLVLHEMVTGQRAFRRDSSAETMAAIIRDEADPLPAATPTPLRWVIERLLSKDPADRYESSRDLYRELRQVRDRLSQATTSSHAAPVMPAPTRRHPLRAAALVAVGLAVGAALAGVFGPRQGGTGVDLSNYQFTPVSLATPTERNPAWSPDGVSLAYTASINGVLQVMTRTLASSQAAQLTHLQHSAGRPFWSPDGSTIYFTSRASGPDAVSSLWSINATGGAPELVIEGATSAAIHPQGKTFAFWKNARLYVGDDPRAGGGPPREFGEPPFDPLPGVVNGFSPDGSRLAVLRGDDLWVLDYPSGQKRQILSAQVLETSWMPDSQRLVVREGTSPSNYVLSLLDMSTDGKRIIYAGPFVLLNPAVSPDGRRIAFVGGAVGWDLVEVHVSSGRVQTMPSAGGVSWWPAWAPSGSHYAFVNQEERPTIRNMSTAEDGGFARVLVEMPAGTGPLQGLRWAPDGNRLSFGVLQGGQPRLMLANASGGRALPVDEGARGSSAGVWSPDGEWLAYQRRVGSEVQLEVQLVKTRPGSRSVPEVLKKWRLEDASRDSRTPVEWSPDGHWILTSRGNVPELFLVSADGATERQLSARSSGGRPTLGFSRDGRAVLLLEQNISGAGAPWRLFSIDVATSAERLVADVALPPTAGDAAGFSLHPDGTRFLTSIANWPFDLWMLEGFAQ